MRSQLAAAASRLRYGWLGVVEATAAASVAWVLATRLLHHRQAFFAPAAALIVLGQARGQRIRRAIEILVGVSVGIFIADLVARALGPHSTTTVFVVILLTLTITLALNAGPLLVVQASVSAVYVAVVIPVVSAPVTNRFVDALVGGGIAVVVSQLRGVRDPLRPLLRQLDVTFDEISGVVDDVAFALSRRDEAAARAALARARAADATVGSLRAAILAAEEGLLLRIHRRQRVAGVRDIDQAVQQVDYAVRGMRLLARGSITLLRHSSTAPDALVSSMRSLADQARAVHATLAAGLRKDEPVVGQEVAQTQAAALSAARSAALAVDADTSVPLVMLVGQIRLTAVDLLRASDADDAEVLEEIDAVLRLVTR
ncbi:MAG: FUSC family protein [Actinomycetes bacterium]